MVKRYFLRSCYNAFSELQLQSRLPGASQYRSCFATRSRANAFCHSRLQPRIAGASHQIDQRSRSPGNGDDSALRRKCFFFCVTFCEIELSLQSGAHFAHLIFQKCSGFVNFFHILKCNSSSRYSPVHYLSTTAPERGSEPRKQTTLAIPGAILPKKRWVLHPRVFFTRECTRFRTVTRPKWLT